MKCPCQSKILSVKCPSVKCLSKIGCSANYYDNCCVWRIENFILGPILQISFFRMVYPKKHQPIKVVTFKEEILERVSMPKEGLLMEGLVLTKAGCCGSASRAASRICKTKSTHNQTI